MNVAWEYYYSTVDGMLVYRRVTPCNLLGFRNASLLPIYTPGERFSNVLKVAIVSEARNVPGRFEKRTPRRRGGAVV